MSFFAISVCDTYFMSELHWKGWSWTKTNRTNFFSNKHRF